MTTQDQLCVPPHMNGRHRHTYDAIFRHPATHNLEWHDVRSLLESLSEVTEGHNGAIHVTRNGQMLMLPTPKHKDVATVEELLGIRHFLERSGEKVILPSVAPGIHLLVVIDHHEAKIYRTELHGAVSQHLTPYDPHGFGRHLVSANEETQGKRCAERKSFYEAIAATLQGAEEILLFGDGTGESSAMEKLLAELKHFHKDLAEHVIGSVVIDAHHITDEQLLAKARELFVSRGV